jgi:hypothetical protein
MPDGTTADAPAKAIALKRGPGHPPKLDSDQLLDLLWAMWEVLRADPTLSDRAACDAVAERPEWQGWSGDALRQQLKRFAKKNGLTLKQVIDKIVASLGPGH